MSSFNDYLAKYLPGSYSDGDGYWYPGTFPSTKAQGRTGAQSSSGTQGDSATLTYLGHYDFLSLQGPDSRTFLQGQTTCDWRQLGTQQASWGSYCNIKGRMMASFIGGFLADDHILLRLRRDIAADTRDTLAKYIVFSKAEIDFQPSQWLALGLWGPGAGQLLEGLGLAQPGAQMAQSTNGQSLAVQLDHAGERFELWLDADAAQTAWQTLSDHTTLCSGEDWQCDNIRAGLADICAATRDEFLPQMLHYQLIGGLSFKKGCYAGQEVVARMHYRGSLKRRLYRGHYSQEVQLAEGERLYAEGSQSVGQIVHRAQGPNGTEVLVALTKTSAATPNTLRSEEGTVGLQLLPLPYALPEDDGEVTEDSD